jgi:hypothetical protein
MLCKILVNEFLNLTYKYVKSRELSPKPGMNLISPGWRRWRREDAPLRLDFYNPF